MAPTDRIPTLDRLGATVAADLDHKEVATRWFTSFSASILSKDVDDIIKHIVDDAFWRDLLAFTWDFRTFDGSASIRQFLADRLQLTALESLQLTEPIMFQQPFPDLAWILSSFSFHSAVGHGTGVFRLVPTASGEWRAHSVFTNLEGLRGFPEKIGSLRLQDVVPDNQYLAARRQECAFDVKDPTVLIIGAGHAGLSLAARLKYLDVPTLVVDRSPKVGDSWRNRYDSLCLHWPVWFDHMPYLPFPPTWPVYSPASKIADWLESYAKLLELNVWSSAEVTEASQQDTGTWVVTVSLLGRTRVLNVNHLVFATGLGEAFPLTPSFPGQSNFKGEILHSTNYKTGRNFKGKKVVVIGTGNSGHDICADLSRLGEDVTMFQRGPTFVMDLRKNWKFMGGALYSETSPPVEVADRLFHSMPFGLQANGMAQRAVKRIVDSDKELLEALNKVGFRTHLGMDDAGILVQLRTRGGGHYFDIGASQLIIDRKIKLKSDSQINCLTPHGIKFEDNSELPADVIVCATGLGDFRGHIRKICGDKIADDCQPLFGIDVEGETKGAYRSLGIDRLWYMWGTLSLCRFYSKHLALQIKAQEENLMGKRYSLTP